MEGVHSEKVGFDCQGPTPQRSLAANAIKSQPRWDVNVVTFCRIGSTSTFG